MCLCVFVVLHNYQFSCVPFATFQFMEQFSNQRGTSWKSGRHELLMMARAIPFMVHHAGRHFGDILFASDAMGANDLDCGGLGIVASDISEQDLVLLRNQAEHVGKSVARVNGDVSGLKSPGHSIVPTVPFSMLPDTFFAPARWSAVQAGRWKVADHVNRGELRGVVR